MKGKKNEKTYPIIQSSSEGRLRIETKDFFENPKIREQIKKGIKSSIVKNLQKKNTHD